MIALLQRWQSSARRALVGRWGATAHADVRNFGWPGYEVTGGQCGRDRIEVARWLSTCAWRGAASRRTSV